MHRIVQPFFVPWGEEGREILFFIFALCFVIHSIVMQILLRLFVAVLVLVTFPWGGGVLAQEVLPELRIDSLSKHRPVLVPEMARPSSLDLPKGMSLHKFELSRNGFDSNSPMGADAIGLSKGAMRVDLPRRRLTLSGSFYEGMNSQSQWHNGMLYSIQRGLQADYKLDKKLSLELSGMIGYTSLPSTFHAYKQYDLYGGLRYDANKSLSLGAGVSVGGFMGTRYLNPRVYAGYNPSDNWEFGLYGGVNLIHLPPTRGYGYQSLYSGMTFKYTADQGVFVYGKGFTSQSNAPYFGWTPQPGFWSMGVGGGIGYNIPGYGPVSVGVDYVYNPLTKRMEPVYSLNIVNGLIYLIEQVIQGLQ